MGPRDQCLDKWTYLSRLALILSLLHFLLWIYNRYIIACWGVYGFIKQGQSLLLFIKLKHPAEGKVIIVCREEEYIVSHLTSFRYVEVEGEIHETPFQAFETVHAVNFPPPEQKKKPEIVMSSLKDVRAVVEDGDPEG